MQSEAMRDRLRRPRLLRAIAAGLEADRACILETASGETALTIGELTPEFARMTGTLRMFAGVVEEGSWVRASIDTRAAEGVCQGAIGPNHDIRRMLVPLGRGDGVVAVFGSSNFPLAYGVCGGDTASALAAGCAVVVKEHPAHPRTGRLIAERAQAAIGESGASPALLGYVRNEDPRDFGVARALVQHAAVVAVGFTGSIQGGRAIQTLAGERSVPIPVFAEMGSVNPVFVTPGAIRARPKEIATQIAESVLMRVGQQCTKPGLVFFEAPEGHVPASESVFVETLADRFRRSTCRDMLAPWIRESFTRRSDLDRGDLDGEELATPVAFSHDASGLASPRGVQPVLWETTLDKWRAHPELREEMFGPSLILVEMPSWSGVGSLELGGHLTLSICFDERDPEDVKRAADLIAAQGHAAGRIIFNGVPTGVRVGHGMVHGGPLPATNRPESTAVGPHAMERWCRPVCWQNCPGELLPEELADANPLGIWRMCNGSWTRSGVA